jgi:hypothetical protein
VSGKREGEEIREGKERREGEKNTTWTVQTTDSTHMGMEYCVIVYSPS